MAKRKVRKVKRKAVRRKSKRPNVLANPGGNPIPLRRPGNLVPGVEIEFLSEAPNGPWVSLRDWAALGKGAFTSIKFSDGREWNVQEGFKAPVLTDPPNSTVPLPPTQAEMAAAQKPPYAPARRHR